MQRAEVAGLTDAFDGGYLIPVVHTGQREASVDPASVHHDSTGTALSVITALFAACQSEMVAQGIQKRCEGIEIQPLLDASDGQVRFHGKFLWLNGSREAKPSGSRIDRR